MVRVGRRRSLDMGDKVLWLYTVFCLVRNLVVVGYKR